jgi:hypothetical protein
MRRPRSQEPTIASANKAVQPGPKSGPTPPPDRAQLARLKIFDANAAKGSKVAGRFVDTLINMRFNAKDAVWSPENTPKAQRVGELTPGLCLYAPLNLLSNGLHEEIVERYVSLTDQERLALGLTNDQRRFMAAMVINRDTEQGLLEEAKVYSYLGQVWSPKQQIKDRLSEHYGGESSKNPIKMQWVFRPWRQSHR